MKQIDYIRKNKGLVKAAVYARFSSDRQREESIEAQIRAIKEHANREGLTIVKTYIDRAKTATTDRRPGFLQMIHDSKEKMFDVVIVHKLDRFARSRADSIGYKMELKRAGVSLLSITEPIDVWFIEGYDEGIGRTFTYCIDTQINSCKQIKICRLSRRHMIENKVM